MRILVTGATGYVGGRLVPRLLGQGHEVHVLVRDRHRLAGRDWSESVEAHEGDLLDPDTLRGICDGIDTAYYLVHSMGGKDNFAEVDRRAATHFVEAAKPSDTLQRVVYLGGLQPSGDGEVSGHLTSRAEVGQILRDGLPTTEFRAGPIIGSGSASFEMVRYLTERLPVMLTPKWVDNEVQPIAVRDILAYLEAAGEQEPLGIMPVGGNRVTFRGMMQQYAEARGLMKRWIIKVPVLAPGFAARWTGFVTPIPNSLAVPLVEGVARPLVIEGDKAGEQFPEIEPIPYREAVELALTKVQRGEVETRWSGALGRGRALKLEDKEGIIREVRTVSSSASRDKLFTTFTSLGGQRGYLAWNWAWWLRGVMDVLIGGPGVRRGRRDPKQLLPGEAMDWWRVETVDRPSLLRLRAEMKVPGRAWLQWEAKPPPSNEDVAEAEANSEAAIELGEEQGCDPDARSCLVQTALFEPKGLPGALYWYVLYPMHYLIFTAMAKAIVREAKKLEDED